MTHRGIVWFRRDLRLADNPTLLRAIDECAEITPLFIVDDRFWDPAGANRRWFLAGSLGDFNEQLGGRLVIRHDYPVAAIGDIVHRHGVTRLYRAADAGPTGQRRETEVDDALRGIVETIVVDQPYVAALDAVRTTNGQPFKVFTPTCGDGRRSTSMPREGGRTPSRSRPEWTRTRSPNQALQPQSRGDRSQANGPPTLRSIASSGGAPTNTLSDATHPASTRPVGSART